MFAQRAVAGSRIEALDAAPPAISPCGSSARADDWRVTGAPAPLYLVAVASDAALPEMPGESSLIDYGLEVLAEREARFVAELDREAARLLVAAHARAQRAEDEARRVQESVAWRALERIRRRSTASLGRGLGRSRRGRCAAPCDRGVPRR